MAFFISLFYNTIGQPDCNHQKGELYNLKDDPSEEKNLYEERPDPVQHLTELMEKWGLEVRSAPIL